MGPPNHDERKPEEERVMWDIIWTEAVRLGFAFGCTGVVIWCWYWLMDNTGTF